MLKLNSKAGITKGSPEVAYNYISDFRNFARLLPSDQLRNLKITGDTLEFDIGGLGSVGLKIAEKQPFTQLVIKATEDSSADFTFWINIADASAGKSQVSITLQANLNMFLEMMAKGPLQQFVDLIVDKLALVEFKE
jgi:carbon monoxide dehydrogenase subunit G